LPPSHTKSPLKDRPLRVPGQSLDEEIDELLNSKMLIYFLAILTFGIVTLFGWMEHFGLLNTNPWVLTGWFIVITAYSIYKMRKIRATAKRLALARDGEREVGQFLDTLQRDGARVLHDIREKAFNVDHVVISPHGVFVIETKTYSKPAQGKPLIRVTKGQIFINGYRPDHDPLEQAQALGRWIHDLLYETTGKHYPIQPVVLFPGWYIENSTADPRAWVLNPKALPSFIQHSPKRLPESDIRLAFYHLARYVRSTNTRRS